MTSVSTFVRRSRLRVSARGNRAELATHAEMVDAPEGRNGSIPHQPAPASCASGPVDSQSCMLITPGRDRTGSLNFPNPSHSYDASRHCVCFWGYDNSREIAFLVDDAVLSKLSPGMGSGEPAVLAAFDRPRDRILG